MEQRWRAVTKELMWRGEQESKGQKAGGTVRWVATQEGLLGRAGS